MLSVSGLVVQEVPSIIRTQPFSEETLHVLGPRVQATSAPVRSSRVDEEPGDGWWMRQRKVEESILDFWRRMEYPSEYRIIPKVGKILFSVPSPSAQIEKDFSVSGNLVTPQRT